MVLETLPGEQKFSDPFESTCIAQKSFCDKDLNPILKSKICYAKKNKEFTISAKNMLNSFLMENPTFIP